MDYSLGKGIEIISASPGGYFSIVELISEDSLLEEVKDWQSYFFLMVALILIVGGALIPGLFS